MEQEISLVFPVVRKIIQDCYLFSQNAVCMPGSLCWRITMQRKPHDFLGNPLINLASPYMATASHRGC
jgi:hypothetical protein